MSEICDFVLRKCTFQVKGYIHHERRLHRLLLQEVTRQRDEHMSLQTPFDMASPSALEEAPDVRFRSLSAFSVQIVWVVGVDCGMAETQVLAGHHRVQRQDQTPL